MPKENPMDQFFSAAQKVLAEEQDNGGNKPDSSTGADAEAGKEVSDPAADEKKTADVPKEEGTDDGQELDFIEKDGKKYYRSFDKHPEWAEMREAQKTLNQILEDRGYDSLKELNADLEAGNTLVGLLGTTDAETVKGILEKARKMDLTEEYWAEQEVKKREEGETQEETIQRLKDENLKLKKTRQTEQERQQQIKENRDALLGFNSEVERVVDGLENLSDDAKSVTKMFLGVDNPMDEVDITDKKAVKAAIKQTLGKFQDFLKGYSDAVIQQYVEGKKAGPKIPAESVDTDIQAVETKKAPEGATMEELFAFANEQLIEELNNAARSPNR